MCSTLLLLNPAEGWGGLQDLLRVFGSSSELEDFKPNIVNLVSKKVPIIYFGLLAEVSNISSIVVQTTEI